MLAPKIDKKKLIQSLAVLGVIFALIIYIVLKNFVSKGEEKPAKTGSTGTSTVLIKVDVEKKFDNSLIQDEKFKNLKENVVQEKDFSELEVGNDNIFNIMEVEKIEKKTETKTETETN